MNTNSRKSEGKMDRMPNEAEKEDEFNLLEVVVARSSDVVEAELKKLEAFQGQGPTTSRKGSGLPIKATQKKGGKGSVLTNKPKGGIQEESEHSEFNIIEDVVVALASKGTDHHKKQQEKKSPPHPPGLAPAAVDLKTDIPQEERSEDFLQDDERFILKVLPEKVQQATTTVRRHPNCELVGPGAYSAAPGSSELLRSTTICRSLVGAPFSEETSIESNDNDSNEEHPPPSADGHNIGWIENGDDKTTSINLTEASPVSDDEEQQLPIAIEQSNNKLKSSERERGTKLWAVILVGIVVVSALTLGLVVWKKEASVAVTMSPVTQSPAGPPSLSLESQVLGILARSGHSLEFDAPQHAAFEWLVEDPFLTSYPDWRVCQRFALATFYHSTGGQIWMHNDGWLDYNIHECQWQSGDSFLVKHGYINVTHPGPCEEDPYAEDAKGIYKHIDLNDNNLMGTLPLLELSMLSSLRSINLHGNQITGTLSSHVGQLQSVEAFGLAFNALSGPIPSQLGILSTATGIWMIDNKLEGTVPTELGLLRNIEEMMFDFNSLTGSIPSELATLSNLRYLEMPGNQLTGSLPTELGLMNNILFLGLDENLLTGTFPTQHLPRSLTALLINRNSLTGTLPPLGSLTNARVLSLFGNQFHGMLPTEFGILSNLEKFSLNDNRLSGTVPTQFGLLDMNLQWMLIHNNQITGRLPSQLGNLRNLTRFRAENNSFTGIMPMELVELELLKDFNVAGNQLSSMPIEMLDLCSESCGCDCLQQNQTTMENVSLLVQNATS